MKTLIEILNDQADMRRWLHEQCFGLPSGVMAVPNRTEFITPEVDIEGRCVYSQDEHALYVYHNTRWEEILGVPGF